MEDIPVAADETADNVLEKVENILKEPCSSLSDNVIDQAHRIGSNYKCFKTNNPAAASLYVSTVSSIEHCSVGTGIN